MRRILFVDDEPRILDGLQRMLRSKRSVWDMHFATGPAAALASFRERAFDVVVTDMRMPEMDGAELLEHILQHWPSTVRLVLSGQTAADAATRAAHVAHQFLSKPCDPEELFDVIERVCSLQGLLGDDALREVAGSVESLPAIPAVYASLEAALASPNVVIPTVAAIVERDPAISAKLLQLVNSSFFGRARKVARVEQAVAFLGLNVLRSLMLAHEIAAHFEGTRAAQLVSLEEHQSHALFTAAIAKQLVPAGADAETAFIAAVLHDVGKLLLAARLPEYWSEVSTEAAATGCPVHPCEIARRRTSHAELGAYLLGLWGLPLDIVGAVAFHHAPASAPEGARQLAWVLAVADALAHEVSGGPPNANLVELAQASGRPGTLDDWRRAAARILAGD